LSGFQLATLASTQTNALVNTNLQKHIYTNNPQFRPNKLKLELFWIPQYMRNYKQADR
jgi:hypothetical protein